MSMNDGQKIIFDAIAELRKEMNSSFRETRDEIKQAHKRIDEVEKEISEVDKKVAVTRIKLGFLAVIIAGGAKALDIFVK